MGGNVIVIRAVPPGWTCLRTRFNIWYATSVSSWPNTYTNFATSPCSSRNCASFEASPPKFCPLCNVLMLLSWPPKISSLADGLMPNVPIKLAVRLIRLPPAGSCVSVCIIGAAIPLSLINGASMVNSCSNWLTSFTFFSSSLPTAITDLTIDIATFLRLSQGKNASNIPKSGNSSTIKPILSNGTDNNFSNSVIATGHMSISMLFFVPPPNTIPWPIILACFCSCNVPNALAQLLMHLIIKSVSCGAILSA